MIDGLPETLELTLVRDDLLPVGIKLSNKAAPTEGLDTPCLPGKPDYELSWWVTPYPEIAPPKSNPP